MPPVTPLQFGVPGGMELLVVLAVLAIPIAISYWVFQDASTRGSDHPLAWAAMAFVSVLGYGVLVVVFVAFYLVVRDDIGTA